MTVEVKYGIVVTLTHWACENGGDDITGTREELEAKVAGWKAEWERKTSGVPNPVRFRVLPYKKEKQSMPDYEDLIRRLEAAAAEDKEDGHDMAASAQGAGHYWKLLREAAAALRGEEPEEPHP